ncbi:MAG: type III pantothenate kinase [Ekhidna sp.]|nr:type III pantothenate kinase [Ekhidna sp.]MBC6410185.1 type III pantothenate kinase [Ekhidna sp.]MBC6427437.1 type III pantothenate kinase [Ekhidna sp.]
MNKKIEVLLIDIGNTCVKSAEVINKRIESEKKWNSLSDLKETYQPDVPFCICNTGKRKLDFGNRPVWIVSHKSRIPLSLDYKTPETLGPDRIAAAVGCFELFPGLNSLLIDIGTCVTIDFISKKGIFEGGIISPGLKMRMKSMAESTANLPDISDEWGDIERSKIGKTTKECILQGSYFGIIREINEVIATFKREFTSINVILSGGDANHFESHIKAHIFAGSKMVLKGLYRIWKNQ